MRRVSILLLACAAQVAIAKESSEWNFTVTLDGKPIGMHRFLVAGMTNARTVSSQTDLVVRVLGIPFYRYSHSAEEKWQGECLRELRSETDDDGRRQKVDQRFDNGCLMSFAYWNPKLIQQSQLVDPQTGRAGPVRFEAVAEGSIELRGRSVRAQGWRLVADKQRITVWYASEGGRWIGLDADAKGGSRLSYRITADERPTTP